MMHHSNGSQAPSGSKEKSILEQVEELIGKKSEKQ